MSVILDPRRKRWFLEPGAVACQFPPDRDGYELFPLDIPLPAEVRGAMYTKQWLKEMGDNINAALNLCVMLNLANVTTSKVEASEAINRKRRRLGRQPLYAYRVLVVDGERWDRAESSEPAEGGGVRSHFRRGHIRRLDDERRVWVRATYVHGGRAGFIEKDYELRGELGQ